MKRKLFRPERALKTAFVYLLVLLVSFLFAFPCIWLVLSAFNAEGDLLTLKGFLIPSAASSPRPTSTTIRGGSATPSSWRR